MTTTWDSLDLSAGHVEALRRSAISAEVAGERGYRSVTDPAALRELGFSEAQAVVPTLLIPLHDTSGQVAGHQHRPDVELVDRTGRRLKYVNPRGQGNRVDVPPRCRDAIGDPSKPLLVTEGVKKADAAASAGLVCVALKGVDCWRGRNAHGGNTALADWADIALAGRKVGVAFDSDIASLPQVRRAAQGLARYLANKKAEVVFIVIPPGPGGVKQGLDDWLVANPGAEPWDLAVPRLGAPATPTAGDRPVIVAGDRQLRDITADALDALRAANDPPEIFVRGGALARRKRDVTGFVMDTLGPAALRGRLARVADWVRTERQTPVQVSPPKDVVEDILSLPSWPQLPTLDRIVPAPVFTAEGDLLAEPGHHPHAGTWYEPAGLNVPEIPHRPSGDDVARARHLLEVELLGDFPFVGPAERAHAMALVLLPFARALINGPTPLHGIEAPSAGTGKGLLAEVCTYIFTAGSTGALAADCRDGDEWRKRITATLMKGAEVVFLDNMLQRVDSGALASALTATRWSDRLLGSSRQIDLPVRCVWLLAANNPRYSTEIARRVVRIRMDARLERPESREGFRHPDLLAWVGEHRAELVHAALVLIQAWVAAGRPPGTVTKGSYEAWARVMGGILDHAGIEGFLANRDELTDAADTELVPLRAFTAAWWDLYGEQPVRADQLFDLIEKEDLDLPLGDGNERSQKSKLGRLLKRNHGRTFADRYRLITGADDRHLKVSTYRLEHLAEPPSDTERVAGLSAGLLRDFGSEVPHEEVIGGHQSGESAGQEALRDFAGLPSDSPRNEDAGFVTHPAANASEIVCGTSTDRSREKSRNEAAGQGMSDSEVPQKSRNENAGQPMLRDFAGLSCESERVGPNQNSRLRSEPRFSERVRGAEPASSPAKSRTSRGDGDTALLTTERDVARDRLNAALPDHLKINWDGPRWAPSTPKEAAP